MRAMLRDAPKTGVVRRLWRHSIATAVIAKELAPIYGVAAGVAHTAGILPISGDAARRSEDGRGAASVEAQHRYGRHREGTGAHLWCCCRGGSHGGHPPRRGTHGPAVAIPGVLRRSRAARIRQCHGHSGQGTGGVWNEALLGWAVASRGP